MSRRNISSWSLGKDQSSHHTRKHRQERNKRTHKAKQLAMATTVLVTGSKSGIGKGLLSAYAARNNTTVIAAIRDGPHSAIAQSLTTIPTGHGSKVIVVEYDASSATAATDLAKTLRQDHNINHLDIVIANAGILKQYGPGLNATPEEFLEHFQINTIGPLLLYQGTADLLNASKQTPKFFVVSSNIGSNTLMDSYPLSLIAYGTSKAAVNFVASKLHREEERIVVVPVQPGWVQTNMGEKAATFAGMNPKDVPVTLEQSVNGLIAVFDKADKENYSGKFWDQNGKIVPW